MNYLNDNIIFQDNDTLQETLTKIVYLNAGNHTLSKELAKHRVTYVKVSKGVNVSYILRGAKIESKLIVKL